MKENFSKGLVGKLSDVQKGDLILLIQNLSNNVKLISGQASGYVVELDQTQIKLSIENPFAKIQDYAFENHILVRANLFRATTTYNLAGFDNYEVLRKAFNNEKEQI